MLVAAALNILATSFVIDRFVVGQSEDPLTKAGGLSQEQRKISH
jgi:hypothetical protein